MIKMEKRVCMPWQWGPVEFFKTMANKPTTIWCHHSRMEAR